MTPEELQENGRKLALIDRLRQATPAEAARMSKSFGVLFHGLKRCVLLGSQDHRNWQAALSKSTSQASLGHHRADRLTRMLQEEKTPRTEAAFKAYIYDASLEGIRREMRKLETELTTEREQRQLAERDRDRARAQRDQLKAIVADTITQLQNGISLQ